jgi:membrane protease YdiL (CAAX protease family)
MFRGAIMGHLRKYGDLSAIIVSAFLFGVVHGNLIQMPFAFILGLYLGYVAVKTRNIVYPMLIHAVNNGVATIVNYIADSLGETGEIIVGLVYTAMVVGLGIIGLIILIKNRKMDYPLREEQGIFPAGKKFGIMLSTPLIWPVFAWILYETVHYVKFTGVSLW